MVHRQFTANNSPRTIHRKQFTARAIQRRAIHRRGNSLQGSSPQDNSPQTIHRNFFFKVGQFTAEQVHRKQFTAGQFTARAIHRRVNSPQGISPQEHFTANNSPQKNKK
jgi:hypothetical protein